MVKKLLTLAALVALLIALILIYRTLAAIPIVRTGPPGVTLYAAGFDDAALDWSQYDDGQLSARVSEGAFMLTVNAGDTGAFSAAAPVFGDFDVRAEARASAGPLDNSFGLIFRLQNGGNTRTDDDSFYLFLISSDGYYRVTRTLSGSERVLSDWIPSDAIVQGIGAVNHVRVTARAGRFSFSVNGQPLAVCLPNAAGGQSTFSAGECVDGTMTDVLEDDAVAYGQLGLIARSTDTGGPGVSVAFDRVIVSMPEATP